MAALPGRAWLFAAFFFCGCAASIYDRADNAITRGDNDSAIALLEEHAARHSNDPAALRELGIAEFRAGRSAEARTHLMVARSLDRRDVRALLYLGLLSESAGQPDSAIAFYRECAERKGSGRERRLLEGRIRRITSDRLRAEVKTAIAGEARIGNPGPAATIAVLPFAAGGTASPDEERIGRALALLLTTDLGRVHGLTIVERARLNILVDEIKLGSTPAIPGSRSGAPATIQAPRAGRLVGAGTVVSGVVLGVGEGTLRVNASSTPTSGGKDRPEITETDRLALLFDLEKRLAFGLLDQMGVSPTPAEMDLIRKYRPTQNLEALLAWSDGCYYLDVGDAPKAQESFDKAVEIDPGFKEAGDLKESAQNEQTAGSVPDFTGIAPAPALMGDAGSPLPESPIEVILNDVGGTFSPAEPEQADPRVEGIGNPPATPPTPGRGGQR